MSQGKKPIPLPLQHRVPWEAALSLCKCISCSDRSEPGLWGGKRGPGYCRVSLVADSQLLASDASLSSWFMVYICLRKLIKGLMVKFLTTY